MLPFVMLEYTTSSRLLSVGTFDAYVILFQK